MGGNGLNTIGLKINSNDNNNYVGLGRFTEKADRNLHIDINQSSFDNSKKNGIVIESKNINNEDTFPDIKLINYDKSSRLNNNNILTQLNLGIGSDADNNNILYVSTSNENYTTIQSLNNFKFAKMMSIKKYPMDTSLDTDTIKTL